MNTDRFRFQEHIEQLLGCSDLRDWGNFKDQLTQYRFSNAEAQSANELLLQDAKDLYFKSALSLCKALNSLFRGYHSWTVVKLYYSVFYSMRAHSAVLKVGFVRNRGLYRWKVEENHLPIKVDGRSYRGKTIRGDHESTIFAFKDIFPNDVLLSNEIENENLYFWIMDQRNKVQYRDRTFSEPLQKYFHSNLFNKNKFEFQVIEYIKDSVPIYAFDPDHCLMAAPIRRFLDCKRDFLLAKIPDPLLNHIPVLSNLLGEIVSERHSTLYSILDYK